MAWIRACGGSSEPINPDIKYLFKNGNLQVETKKLYWDGEFFEDYENGVYRFSSSYPLDGDGQMEITSANIMTKVPASNKSKTLVFSNPIDVTKYSEIDLSFTYGSSQVTQSIHTYGIDASYYLGIGRVVGSSNANPRLYMDFSTTKEDFGSNSVKAAPTTMSSNVSGAINRIWLTSAIAKATNKNGVDWDLKNSRAYNTHTRIGNLEFDNASILLNPYTATKNYSKEIVTNESIDLTPYSALKFKANGTIYTYDISSVNESAYIGLSCFKAESGTAYRYRIGVGRSKEGWGTPNSIGTTYEFIMNANPITVAVEEIWLEK